MPAETAWERRRLRAPRANGELLAIPPLPGMSNAVESNRKLIATWDTQILGRPLSELRRIAREETCSAAMSYVSSDSLHANQHDATAAFVTRPLIVSGHQPTLFHPGVWFKNFLLNALARSTAGVGLHLIVDTDQVGSTSIAVPVGTREQPRQVPIEFDTDGGSTMWEEALLRDDRLFRTFPDRVCAAVKKWPLDPMLPAIWPAAIARLDRTTAHDRPRISDLLTAVRRKAESLCGIENLELPVSHLCESDSFAWFVASLIDNPHRTHLVYNSIVAAYRRANRVRNRQHPVPDLRTRTNPVQWVELPFWMWRAGDSQRARMFACTSADKLQLSANDTTVAEVTRSTAASGEPIVEQLRDLADQGWKVRPRALITTMFARVFLADVFVHGIGGSKYDEMTDRLIEQFFGIIPPVYLTATATHHLPLHGWPVTPADVATLKHRRWDFQHNPERSATESRSAIWEHQSLLEAEDLLHEKLRLVEEQNSQDRLDRRDERRLARDVNDQRRQRLRTINRQLANLAAATQAAVDLQLQSAEQQLTANSVLNNREFSFCLFSLDELPQMAHRQALAALRAIDAI